MNEHLTAFPSLSEKKPQKYGRKQKTPPSPEEKGGNFPGGESGARGERLRRESRLEDGRLRGVPGVRPKNT